jgi:hypothetical protein
MRKMLSILYILPFVVLFMYGAEIKSQETLPSDYTGYYTLSNQEGLKAFPEIENMMLWKNDNPKQESTLRPVEGSKLEGAIRAKQKGSKDLIRYKSITTSTKDSTISFSTETVAGIRYEFKGKFHASGSIYQAPSDSNVLTGYLIKKRGTEVLAESNVSFTFFEGD